MMKFYTYSFFYLLEDDFVISVTFDLSFLTAVILLNDKKKYFDILVYHFHKGTSVAKESRKTKHKQMQEHYEQIIALFDEHHGQLSTGEVYRLLQERHDFAGTVKTVENHLKQLRDNAVEHVFLTWRPRQKHILKDHRDLKDTHVDKRIEKLRSIEVMHGEERAYMRLAMEAIRELDTLSSRHHKDIEKRLGLSGMQTPYFIEHHDMETIDMSDPDILLLKDAIEKDYITRFRFSGKGKKTHYIVEPYKLMIFEGVWYLFAKDTEDEETPYKTWRLTHIHDIEYDPTQTHKISDAKIEEMVVGADSPTFQMDTSKNEPVIPKDISVTLRIDRCVSYEFDHEAHIPGECIRHAEDEEGNILVTTKINTYTDIDRSIKEWIPHIEILEPEEYRERFIAEIKAYAAKFQ